MTRLYLVKQLIKRCRTLTPQEAEAIVTSFCQQITTAVARGERVTLRGFGRFTLKVLPPRQGRNPKTGERLDLPTHNRLQFKAAKAFNASLNIGPVLKTGDR